MFEVWTASEGTVAVRRYAGLSEERSMGIYERHRDDIVRSGARAVVVWTFRGRWLARCDRLGNRRARR